MKKLLAVDRENSRGSRNFIGVNEEHIKSCKYICKYEKKNVCYSFYSTNSQIIQFHILIGVFPERF